MMQEVEVLKTIQELICSFFSEEQFTLSFPALALENKKASVIYFGLEQVVKEQIL